MEAKVEIVDKIRKHKKEPQSQKKRAHLYHQLPDPEYFL